MEPNEIVGELRRLEEKHKDDFVPTFGVRISDMARDCANCIERLQAENESLALNGGKYMEISQKRYEMYEAGIKRAEDAESKLYESQRRERAAVEDILVAHDRGRCAVCKYTRQDGGACKKWPDRSCFEWRGPEQEGDAKDE